MTENSSLQTSQGEWRFDPDRNQVIAETHARPSQPISGPAEIYHMAIRCDDETASTFFDALDTNSMQSGPRHRTGTIDDIYVKLEKHTEFMSFTLFQETADKKKTVDMENLLQRKFPMDKVEIIVFLRLVVVCTMPQMLKAIPHEHRIYGGKIRNNIDVRSNFVPDEKGITHFALHAKGATRDEMGRRVQRLIEMETYRTMSLLGLPVARRVGQEISDCEKELEALTSILRKGTETSQKDDEILFEQLSSLSEQNNILLTQTRYRFAASRAYFALFQQRVTSLEEEKVGDVQTMSGFLRSRLEPAMATIESTAKRQETLTNDLSRAIVLLRTRIELNLNKGNQNLLKSMDKRHDQQLKISQTVEGLSIIAITYYAVGLASYVLKAMAAQPWMPLSEKILTAASVPFIFLIVFVSLKRARKAWEDRKASER